MFADFKVIYEYLDEIKTVLQGRKSLDKIYTVELKDKNGKVHCIIEKALRIAGKIIRKRNSDTI